MILRLKRDVAVRAVDDASYLKTPFVVCHALYGRLVFTGEGYACQTSAVEERLPSDVRHARRDRHRRQTAASLKRSLSDARHALRDRHRRQSAAVGECPTPDAHHALRDRHRRQSAAVGEHRLPDASHCASDFDRLRVFYPIVEISTKQSGVDHRLLIYFS